MISFFYEAQTGLKNEAVYSDWLLRVVSSEGFVVGELTYIFCDDTYLLHINRQYLNHDDYTDIISFDYTEGNLLSGDIFISTERVQENAKKFLVPYGEELLRVMAHGVLHLCGYKDKTDKESVLMRQKEDEKIRMFHVEQPLKVSRGTLKK